MTSNAVVIGAVLFVGCAGSAVDLRARRVPNWLTLGTATLGLGLAAAGCTGIGLAAAVAGLIVGACLMSPGYLFGGTGAGDVKLLASMGTLLGPAGVVLAFLYAAIAGGCLAVAVAAQRRQLRAAVRRTTALVATAGGNAADIEHPSANNRFAFAPAIALGALVAALAR